MSVNYLTIFNNHFNEFFDDIHNVFPNDADILTAKNSLAAIRKANPKLLVGIWLSYIYLKYRNQIDAGDINFFLEKDYSEDLTNLSSKKVMEAIDRLREPVKAMNPDDQQKVMKYIQNLSKLAVMYESTKQ